MHAERSDSPCPALGTEIERIVMMVLLLGSGHGPWSLAGLQREISGATGDPIDITDAIDELYGSRSRARLRRARHMRQLRALLADLAVLTTAARPSGTRRAWVPRRRSSSDVAFAACSRTSVEQICAICG